MQLYALIPFQIVVEIIIGALLCCIGSAKVSGRFQNISATTNYAKRWVIAIGSSDSYICCHYQLSTILIMYSAKGCEFYTSIDSCLLPW